MEVPRRRSLPHEVPLWVDPSRETYFITVNGVPRDVNQLAREPVAQGLLETVLFRHERHVWWCRLMLLMPDHLHALMSFPDTGQPIKDRVTKWKEWTAKTLKITWQRDFFEHRLRSEEGAAQKATYILENPVRRGLVQNPREWPYVFFADGPRPCGWPQAG